MFLSRILLDPQGRTARFTLASPQRVHAAILGAFQGADIETPAGRVLWRTDRATDGVMLYIASPNRPSLQVLGENFGVAGASLAAAATADYGPFLASIEQGQAFRFRLTANPTHVATVNGAKKRLAHETAAHQLNWLLERGPVAGFGIPDVDGERAAKVTRRERVEFRRQGARVTLGRVGYDGVLTVSDPEALRRTLTHGLGKAKGYGCGLLTLAPVAVDQG